MRLNVPEMSCRHCTAAIEKAVAQADADATVACDLDNRLVTITSTLPMARLQAALQEAGYASTPA